MSAISISSPFPTFTDVDGDPLESGYIYVGQANVDPVTFPITVYWDAALTIPAAQPIRTIGGYPARNGSPARIYANSDYSIRVTNKNGSLVYSAPAATDRFSGVVVDVDAADVAYTPAGTGAVPTTVQSKLRESVSVLDFYANGVSGAKVDPTGALDSTAGIQAALNSVPNGTVYFPPGTYLTGQLEPPVGTSMVGAGLSSTVLKLKSGSNPGAVIQTPGFSSITGTNSLGGTFNSQISDLTIDGNKANNTSGYGIRLYGKSFRILEVRVQNCTNDGIYTEYKGGDDFTTPLKNLEGTIQNVSTLLCGGSGMVNKGPHDLIITNFISYSNGEWGWKLYQSANAHHVNTYTNVLGGIFVGFDNVAGSWAGVINGSGIVGSQSSLSGWGCLLESGGNNMVASSFGGAIGLEIRANNNTIHGVVANTTAAGVKFNGASSNARLDLTMFNNALWFDVTNMGAVPSYAVVYGADAAGTRQNGAFKGTWFFSGASSNGNTLNGGVIVYNGFANLPVRNDTTQTRKFFFCSESPQTGMPTTAFVAGDRASNSAPSSGAPKGWICNVSGTPGNWISEGNL